LMNLIDYKARERGIEVEMPDEPCHGRVACAGMRTTTAALNVDSGTATAVGLLRTAT
jgi:hypothetical protein